MPKRIWKIDKFHGGLNNNADPRDIEDNELSAAQGVMVDQVGKIRCMGGMGPHYNDHPTDSTATPATSGTIQAGYGLFQFSHDRVNGHVGEHLDENDFATHANWDVTAACVVDTGGSLAWTFDGGGSLLNGSAQQVAADRRFTGIGGISYDFTYTYAESDAPTYFRLTIENFSASSETLTITAGTHTHTFTSHANAATAAFTLTGTSNVGGTTGKGTFTIDNVSLKPTSMDAAETGDNYIAFADTSSTAMIHIYSEAANLWGYDNIDLGSTSSVRPSFYYVDGALRVSDGNFGANNTPKWYGYIDRSFFPESSGEETVIDSWQSLDAGLDAPTSGSLDNDEAADPSPAEGAVSVLFFNSAYNGPGGEWNLHSHDGIALFSSYIYDGDVGDRTGQESLLRQLNNFHDSVDVPSLMKLQFFADPPFNKRVTGGRLYWAEVKDQDAPTAIEPERYLLAEFDFAKGTRQAGADEWMPWDEAGTQATDAESPDNGYHMIKSVPMDETYESINGFSHDYDSISFDGAGYGWKTAVVANRVVYAGNIRMKNKDGIVETMGDAMIKSIVGKFDTFVPDRIIEASVRDGDEIVKLEEYADRILQFKKNKMHLINISQEIEFLEDTFVHKGVTGPAATCKTDYGIAWVNKLGVYLYDGRKVNNLLEKDGRRVIDPVYWNTWIVAAGDIPMIGYLPRKRQLIVIRDSGSGGGDNNVHIYDLVTRSWTQALDRIPPTDVAKTNPITDWNGDLVVAHTTGTIVRWNDDLADASTTTEGNCIIWTKDIDFGQPAQRKKVYRVRISYKGDADTLNVRYFVNGENNTYYDFEGTTWSGGVGTPNGSTATSSRPLRDSSDLSYWSHAELKPDVMSEANNIYSFRLAMDGTVDNDFEINDISIVYRLKPAN